MARRGEAESYKVWTDAVGLRGVLSSRAAQELWNVIGATGPAVVDIQYENDENVNVNVDDEDV